MARYRGELDQIIERLLVDETINGHEVYAISGRPAPEDRPQVLEPVKPPSNGDELAPPDPEG